MISLDTTSPLWLCRFVSGCQVVIGQSRCAPTEDFLCALTRVVEQLPRDINGSDRAIVVSILSRIASRVIQASHLETNDRSASGLLRWLGDVHRADLSRTFTELLAGFGRARPRARGVCEADRCDRLVRLTVDAINKEFTDPALDVERVAASLGVSRRQLSKTLMQQTGFSFKALLRRRRIDAAEAQLKDASLLLKEVIYAVGYRSRRQFERDFLRLRGRSATREETAETML